MAMEMEMIAGTTEVQKLLYLVVVDDDRGTGAPAPAPAPSSSFSSSFRYTRPVLQSTIQLMGCKPRHAFKISQRVFDVIRRECTTMTGSFGEANGHSQADCLDQDEATSDLAKENGEPFELYKKLTTSVVSRETFLDVVCDALSEYKYVVPNQRADLMLACRIRERKESVTILLCGTSGCGKSTLSSLLGSRLGITTVISTDSIRHMMRGFVDVKENPLVWASTYHAGECLDPVAVAEAKAKRKANKLAGGSHSIIKEPIFKGSINEMLDCQPQIVVPGTELIGKRQMAVEGYKAQSEMVIDSLDRLITAWEERKESVIVEGVHLSLNFVMGLMKKHPSITPFMIYITNEEKHMERFAVRAKYMTLDPARNKYVKYIRNIRAIQEYLCNRADKHLVPKINNTNVDRSVAIIHATVFSCLRRRESGEKLYDLNTNTVSVVNDEYRKCAANSLSSKRMFRLIQRMGSSRHLMAIINTDGSVAKAWPVESVDAKGNPMSGNGSEKSVGTPMYGPLQIGKAEPVNLQFGNLGLSAWPSDTGGTSHTGSIDESRADGTDTGSRSFSSCCSSPRISAKELKEELSVSGSEEEAVDPRDIDTDDDLSDVDKEIHEEMEGSVDEESTKSDEEYEDLAMKEGLESGYWSDDEEAREKKLIGDRRVAENNPGTSLEISQAEKYQQNLDLFVKTSEHVPEPPCSYSLFSDGNQRSAADVRMKKRSLSDSLRHRSRSQNISALVKSGSLCC